MTKNVLSLWKLLWKSSLLWGRDSDKNQGMRAHKIILSLPHQWFTFLGWVKIPPSSVDRALFFLTRRNSLIHLGCSFIPSALTSDTNSRFKGPHVPLHYDCLLKWLLGLTDSCSASGCGLLHGKETSGDTPEKGPERVPHEELPAMCALETGQHCFPNLNEWQGAQSISRQGDSLEPSCPELLLEFHYIKHSDFPCDPSVSSPSGGIADTMWLKASTWHQIAAVVENPHHKSYCYSPCSWLSSWAETLTHQPWYSRVYRSHLEARCRDRTLLHKVKFFTTPALCTIWVHWDNERLLNLS